MQITVLKGQEIKPYTRLLSEMRVREFYNFPYLYVGNVDDDHIYTQGYADSPYGLLAIAFDEEKVIGLFSGMPMETPGSYLDVWCKKLQRKGISTDKLYYAGEIIVQPEFRNKKIGNELTKRLLQEIESIGFTKTLLVTSYRDAVHPLKPQNYFSVDSLWERYGFYKLSFTLSASYPTRQADGTVKEEENQLTCWLRG